MTPRSPHRPLVGRTALVPLPPEFEADAGAELEAACCSVWFVSRSAEHEVTCSTRATRASVA
ncbi:hypothetical protein [Streptomyces sp. NPDC046939]|uniref:hypothetical protein n=1 Tax=Streptomyces sp. NPDC046939 TaxID=3155376 RepID=UPI0033BFBB58